MLLHLVQSHLSRLKVTLVTYRDGLHQAVNAITDPHLRRGISTSFQVHQSNRLLIIPKPTMILPFVYITLFDGEGGVIDTQDYGDYG